METFDFNKVTIDRIFLMVLINFRHTFKSYDEFLEALKILRDVGMIDEKEFKMMWTHRVDGQYLGTPVVR